MRYLLLGLAVVTMATTSCISKKTLESLQADYDQSARDLSQCGQDLNAQMALVEQCEADKETLRGNVRELQTTVSNKDGQINDLRAQIEDLRSQRDKQMEQVTGLQFSLNQLMLISTGHWSRWRKEMITSDYFKLLKLRLILLI